MQVVNNLIHAPASAFNTSTNSSSRVVQSVEKQVSYALKRGGNFSSVAPSLGVKALNLARVTLSGGVRFATMFNKSGSGDLTGDSLVTLTDGGDVRDEDIEAKIYLPGAIVDQLLSRPSINSTDLYSRAAILFFSHSNPCRRNQTESGRKIVCSLLSLCKSCIAVADGSTWHKTQLVGRDKGL